MYNKYQITQLDIRAAQTEAFYHIACSRERGEELVCLCLSYSDEKVLARVCAGLMKALRAYKRAGKLSLIIAYDAIRENTTETKYLFNKYPSLEEDDFLLSGTTPYILVRL